MDVVMKLREQDQERDKIMNKYWRGKKAGKKKEGWTQKGCRVKKIWNEANSESVIEQISV